MRPEGLWDYRVGYVHLDYLMPGEIVILPQRAESFCWISTYVFIKIISPHGLVEGGQFWRIPKFGRPDDATRKVRLKPQNFIVIGRYNGDITQPPIMMEKK